MKAEEKIVAFMFFSVVMQFVYSFEKKQQNLGVGEWRGTRAEGQEGQILVADNRNSSKDNRWGPSIIK